MFTIQMNMVRDEKSLGHVLVENHNDNPFILGRKKQVVCVFSLDE